MHKLVHMETVDSTSWRVGAVGLSLENWSAKILVRGTNFFKENWSSHENFGPTMDQFSMEFWAGGPFFSWNFGSGDQFSIRNFGPP